MKKSHLVRLSALTGSLLFAMSAAGSAFAAESEWFTTEGAKIRLISLPSTDGKKIDAGLQIQLDKGWKTYWRSPGASGLPPQLDFSQSSNIATAKIDYPAPMTFGNDDNLTAGYDFPVTFPITIDPLFSGRPVNLRVAGVIGICAEVCIPVQFALSLLEEGKGLSTRDIASTLLQARTNLVGEQTKDFHVTTARVDGKTMHIEAKIPEGTKQSTALVEGPSSWYLTPARAKSIDGTKAHYEISLKDIPADAAPESTEVTVTLISDGIGVETRLTPARQ
ncbi:MAG: protein-disulfide reductase DsbD domain-containing protein [Rhizobiaceae bacterium]